jgi:LysM repeat protein
VQAVARSSHVTVFTHSRPENPMEHNDVYVDDAELIAVASGGPSVPVLVNPPPAVVAVGVQPTAAPGAGGRIVHVVKPGDTLFAIALQYGVPVDQILALNGLTAESQVQVGRELIIALPAPSPQATQVASSPVVSVGGSGSGRGQVCVRSFQDPNAEGLRLANAAAASGVHFSLWDAQGDLVADHTLDDPSGRYCFTDLPATTYRVAADPPTGYLVTTQQRWAVSLTGDATVDVQLGLRVDPEAGQAAQAQAILIGAGVVLIVAVAAVLIWRRRTPTYY